MANSKFQEININQAILNEKIAVLEKLQEGTDYCRTGKGSYLWRGYGLTHDSINQMIDELNYIEAELKGLIQITVSALRKGGFEFANADNLASNLIQNIEGSLVHTGNSGQQHGGNGRRLDPDKEPQTSEFSKKVNVLSETEGFKQGQNGPSGYDWMNYVDRYTTTSGNTVSIGGSQCFAMSHMIQAEIIGQRGDRIYTSNVSDVKVGDVIHYYGDGADTTYGHWVFVTGISDNVVTVSEGNWQGGAVTHGRQINLNNISLTEIDRVNFFEYK